MSSRLTHSCDRIRAPLRRALLLLAAAGSVHAADFSIDFPLPPADVPSAIATQTDRRNAVIRFLACGKEADVMPRLFIANSDVGEGLSAILMAKLAWLGQLGNFDDRSLKNLVCTTSVTLTRDQAPTEFVEANGQAAKERARTEVDPSCDGFVQRANPIGDLIDIDYEVNGLCMRAQVNKIVRNLVYTKQPGTNNLPCPSQGVGSILTPPIVPGNEARFSQPGDQDMDIRDMTRLYFLNKERALLTTDTREYLRDKLLTLHGPPDDGKYPLLGCGNTEQSTETPQELLDERDFLDDTLDDLGDAALWFARRAALFALLAAPVAAAVEALVALLGAGAAAPAGLAAVISLIGAADIADIRIPETENHRLMIESSRYLKNQIIIDDQPHHPNLGKLQADQDALKSWLLGNMGEIMRRDFAEFNARPYQRLSHFALFNLADFSTDDDVRQGARMVLEFALSKFALASREGIRVAPYRRLVEDMNKNANMLDFGGEGSDHPIATMLYYAGQTQRLETQPRTIEGEKTTKAVSYAGADSMIYAATSSFAPGDPIVDLVIDKKTPYFQRIHHAGIEIYSSAPGYTVAAGGIRTPQALTVQVGPATLGNATDLGTGVPTSFIPSGTGHVNRLRFMRFEGAVEDEGDIDTAPGNNFGFGTKGRIYDHNTCVYRGFACGINYQDAEKLGNQPAMADCFVPGPDGAEASWSFMNSKRCAATTSAPAFFVARFLLPCADKDVGCMDGGRFGFFEAVDFSATPDEGLDNAFNDFRRRVVADNPVIFPGTLSDKLVVSQDGLYRMFGGNRERLVFNAAKHQKDPDKTGIVSVDTVPVPNISAWPLAEGDVLHAKGDGVVRFTNPKLRNTITWDFSDAQHPKRTPKAN